MNSMLRVTTLFFIFLFSMGCTAAYVNNRQVSAGPVKPPPHFQPLAEIDFAEQATYEAQTVGQFTLQETADTGIFFSLHDIDAQLFDLSLIAPDGDRLIILHSEAYRTDEQGGGLWEEKLAPGKYRLLLTAQASQGTMSLSWGHR
jgi:hypothetical protein